LVGELSAWPIEGPTEARCSGADPETRAFSLRERGCSVAGTKLGPAQLVPDLAEMAEAVDRGNALGCPSRRHVALPAGLAEPAAAEHSVAPAALGLGVADFVPGVGDGHGLQFATAQGRWGRRMRSGVGALRPPRARLLGKGARSQLDEPGALHGHPAPAVEGLAENRPHQDESSSPPGRQCHLTRGPMSSSIDV
jgi:hypothetical protein